MEEVRVMKGFLPYFRLLKVYNVENFCGSKKQIFRNISELLFVLFSYVSIVIFLTMLYWKYTEERNYMDPRSLSVFLMCTQIIGTHLSGVRNNRLITNTLWRLQNAIEFR